MTFCYGSGSQAYIRYITVAEFIGSVTYSLVRSSQVCNSEEVFYLMTQSTHFIYIYMVMDIW